MAQQPFYPNAQSLDPTQKTFGGFVVTLTTGNYCIVPAAGMANLTVVAGSGCTATIRRVDNETGDATGNSVDDVGTVSASTVLTTPVDWPWYRVEAAGGSCRVALV